METNNFLHRKYNVSDGKKNKSVRFYRHLNPNRSLEPNNAIARIFEHCGLMTDLG